MFSFSWSAVTSRRTAVASLLLHRSPFAISRLVIPVVVDAMNRKLRRALAHIRKKVRELHPPMANRYSPTSVIAVLRMVCVRATLDHGGPRIVGAAGITT